MAVNSKDQVLSPTHSLQYWLRPIPEQGGEAAFQVVEAMPGGRRFQLECQTRI
jgi:hypothetical protein